MKIYWMLGGCCCFNFGETTSLLQRMRIATHTYSNMHCSTVAYSCMHKAQIFPCKFISGTPPPQTKTILDVQRPQNPSQGGVPGTHGQGNTNPTFLVSLCPLGYSLNNPFWFQGGGGGYKFTVSCAIASIYIHIQLYLVTYVFEILNWHCMYA